MSEGLIDKIKSLGTKIESELDKDDLEFSKLALKEISDFNNSLSLEEFEDEIGSWLIDNNIPKQLNVYDGFGQPPVTIFNNDKFVIDLYFWIDIDTSIHSHSFSGAFKVLYGRSLHEVYKIKPKKMFSLDIMESDIELCDLQVLEPGDGREIRKGNSFNHRLIHLDKPTITLCIRTINDINPMQWHHFSNGLSVIKKEISQEILKNLYYGNYLLNKNEESGKAYFQSLFNICPPSALLNLYERLNVETMGLSENTCHTFFELFNERFEGTKWFELYHSFYSNLQENYYEADCDEAVDRALEHMVNFRYDMNQATQVLSKIQGHETSSEQKDILERYL